MSGSDLRPTTPRACVTPGPPRGQPAHLCQGRPSLSDEDPSDQRYTFHVCLKSFLKCLVLCPKGQMRRARSPGEGDRKCTFSLPVQRGRSRPVVRMCAPAPGPTETAGRGPVGGLRQVRRHHGGETESESGLEGARDGPTGRHEEAADKECFCPS